MAGGSRGRRAGQGVAVRVKGSPCAGQCCAPAAQGVILVGAYDGGLARTIGQVDVSGGHPLPDVRPL